MVDVMEISFVRCFALAQEAIFPSYTPDAW